jgi:hypothetical protein
MSVERSGECLQLENIRCLVWHKYSVTVISLLAAVLVIDFERTWWLLTLGVPGDCYWLWAYLMIIDFELHLVIVINFEHTWWLLLTLRVSDDWYWLWVYLMIVIDFERSWWLLLTLSVPDDCYWLWAYLMIVIDFERTWWLLFKKHVVLTKLDISAFIARLIEKRKCKQ